MGILTDRFGGRAVFSILMTAVAVPVWLRHRFRWTSWPVATARI
jgi:nitrate/nitrite transporter NarK